MAFRKDSEFTWKPINNIAQDSVSSIDTSSGNNTPAPPSNGFLLMTSANFLLMTGADFLLME